MLEPTAPHDFDAAVDLSRKSSSEASAAAAAAMATMAAAAHHHASAEAARAQDDSDEDAPLDLKVASTLLYTIWKVAEVAMKFSLPGPPSR
jgi:SHS2 domain-containing protein